MFHFKVIAIGSSAGGLIPMKEIIRAFPNPFPAAVILIPHLLRDRESSLAAIIGRETHIPVVKVVDSAELQKGFIYVLGEGKVMVLDKARLITRDRLPSERINQSIDEFFTSLAPIARHNAIGVILSGAGDDGLNGARAIESLGGTIFVQQPQSAEFKSMPAALIGNDHPHYILTPLRIAKELIRLTHVG